MSDAIAIKKIMLPAVLLLAVYIGWSQFNRPDDAAVYTDKSDAVLANVFEKRLSGIQVTGAGSVLKILPGDNDGSRHQRFILKLRSGQTLLISHNIDLAPRVPALREGDSIAFYGEYEWNAKGGVIHWTHRDPRGRHASGWLKHNGRTYQ